MSNLVEMRLSDEEKKNMHEHSVLADTPSYPYGLRIELDKNTVKKLGITDAPKVGSEMMIMAKVEVSNVNMTKMQGDEYNMSVSLQITSMGLAEENMEDMKEEPSEPKDDISMARRIYGNK